MEEIFEIERKGHVTVLSTSESLEVEVAARLKNMVKELAREEGLKVVIDMQNIECMDITGCGALVAALRAVRTNDGEIKICRPNTKVLALLKLTRLDNIFEIYEDLDGAIKSFSGAPMKLA